MCTVPLNSPDSCSCCGGLLLSCDELLLHAVLQMCGAVNDTVVHLQDLIKLYTVYNDALINLLEKFFEMKKSECKDTIGVYSRFLMRQESIQRFLQLAEVSFFNELLNLFFHELLLN